MRALKLNDWAVKDAMRRPELTGKKPIARGTFSAVFEGSRPDTVFKMTVDSVGYWLLNCQAARVEGRHFPTVVKNHRDIGETAVGGKKFPIYLFEMERLTKLQIGSAARKTALKISKAVGWGTASQALKWLADADGLSETLREAVLDVQQFANYYENAHLDMHMANFMQRPDGELVITDPLFDNEVYRATYRATYSNQRRQVWSA